ncbi:MAG: VanW family protein [Thermomicrobiales bacterium]|nr:VanW family protein [Thermomicrobiales bacterium]
MAEQLADKLPANAVLTPSLPGAQPLEDDLRQQSRWIRIATRVILGAAILCIAAAAALLVFDRTYESKIYPGVTVGGVDVSGMTRAEAEEAITAQALAIENERAYFDALDRHWAPTFAELGVHVNVQKALDAAFAVGRESSSSTRVGSVLSAVRQDNEIPLTIELSSDELIAWADGVTKELHINPVDAELAVVDGAVNITPESHGKIVDVAKLQGILLDSVKSVSGPNTTLPIIDQQPSVFASDFGPAKTQLDQMLSQSVSVSHDGKKWDIRPSEFGAFLSVDIADGASGPDAVTVVFDEQGLAQWIDEVFSGSINRDPVNAKVAWNNDGGLKATAPGEEGARLLPQSLAKSVVESVSTDHRSIQMPVQVLEPEVNGSNLASLGITTQLGRGSSNFDGSEDSRATNIRVGATVLNGTLVRPHGEFSFNHAVGEITTGLGFVESQVIAGERIGRDIGGGICQVSTTVFRAALYAGLEFTEWHAHRYRLGFYELDGWPVGMDAAIFQPEGDPFGGIDLRFMNPSDSWLLVEAYTDGPIAVVVIYGPDLGYNVDIGGPDVGAPIPATDPIEMVDDELPYGTIKQTEWAGTGLEVLVYRTVYGRNGDVVRSDTFDSLFYPRSNVWTVSPDMQGLSPGAA